jgi:hypothetical protein
MKRATSVDSPAPGSQDTALPGLSSWNAVYGFVLVSFLVWLALLIALTKVFS